jgi:PIN domain nuclease of toxin-antitoxin system
MNEAVAIDTMALVLRLEHRRLPQQVRTLFAEAEEGRRHLLIPAMVLVEIGYLSERGRIDLTLDEVRRYCARCPTVEEVPLTQSVIIHSFGIDDIRELHDRLIAGTASYRNAPLLTNDPLITRSRHLTVIW